MAPALRAARWPCCPSRRPGNSLVMTGAGPPLGLQSAEEDAETGGEALIAVRVPGVRAVSSQGREAVCGQCAEEGFQLLPRRGVAEALLGG